MPKSAIVSGARRRQELRFVQLSNGVEGQIVELCRDLAIEAKRIRQLQQQADQLRIAIRQWVNDFGTGGA